MPTCTARPSSSCGGGRHRSSMPGVGPAGWLGSCPAGASTRSGSIVDRSMIDTARQLAPDLIWVLGDLSNLELGRQFDVVVMAGNVPIFAPAEPGAALVAGCARHVGAGGYLIAGFQLDRGYGVDSYDERLPTGRPRADGRWANLVRVGHSPTDGGIRGLVAPERRLSGRAEEGRDHGPTRKGHHAKSNVRLRRTAHHAHPRLLPVEAGPRPGAARFRWSPSLLAGPEPGRPDQLGRHRPPPDHGDLRPTPGHRGGVV